MTEEKQPNILRSRETPFFKLTRKGNRSFQMINLMKQFGFIPEVIVIERMTSRNNVIRVSAILTEAEIKKEDALRAKVTGKTKKVKE